jgi:urease accessory protein
MAALLATLWQSDSAFPSGSFAFSNGIEGAAALDGPPDRRGLTEIVDATLRHRWATSDRIALLQAFGAVDIERVTEIDRAFEAATLAEPLRVGSRRNGAGFLTAHARLGTPGASEYRAEIVAGRGLGHLCVVQGWVWRALGLDAQSAVAAAGYSAAAGMVNAAIRLGSIGAIEAQAALRSVLATLSELAEETIDEPDAIALSSMTPWLDIAAIRQTRSDVRLFSN